MNHFSAVLLAAIFSLSLVAAIEWGDNAGVAFTTERTVPTCIQQDSAWGWQTSGFTEWSNPLYECHKSNGVDAGGHITENCCPPGFICNRTSLKCQSSSIRSCSDYQTSTSCNNDNAQAGVIDIEIGLGKESGFCSIHEDSFFGNCVRNVDCGCSWNGTYCSSTYSEELCKGTNCRDYTSLTTSTAVVNFCGEGSETATAGSCEYNVLSSDNCDSGGSIITTWDLVDSEGSSVCQEDGVREYQCAVSLSFLGIYSLIIALAGLCVFYIARRSFIN